MTVSFRDHKMKVRPVVAGLAIALLLAPGCARDEGPAPMDPNPSARSDLPRLEQPKLSGVDKGKERQDTSNVEKDLRKDLGGPVIKPDVHPPAVSPNVVPAPPTAPRNPDVAPNTAPPTADPTTPPPGVKSNNQP
jgi:hypothetical protein